MFLAINELNREKARFILIVFVIVLISYLTFFLTSLAYGLATSYTQGIDKWKASGVILNKDANGTIARSLLTEADYSSFTSGKTALLGVGNATTSLEQSDDVSLFGIDFHSFLTPNLTEGRAPVEPDEIIASDALKRTGTKLDTSLRFKGSGRDYTVVGFTDKATFQTAPIVYMTLPEWRALSGDIAGMTGMKDDTTVSAIVTKGPTDASGYATDSTEWTSIRDFSFKLPGYNAQVLTFSLMIGFLIAIASFVLAVFMYILTLQKKSIFGVLKAEGVPSAYISRSVVAQTLLLLATGLVIGLGLTLASGMLLGAKVPFLVNPLFFAAITGLFGLFALLGALASVWAVTKIDPVEAIG